MMDDTLAGQAELINFNHPTHVLRIPPGDDIPLTDRVRRLLDTQAMRHLARISQLGLVGLVYPGATHSRFEHSLGVFRNALLFLKRLVHDFQFAAVVSPRGAEAFLVAALVHDMGHWPFCHPIEDMQLPGLPEHEQRARQLLGSDELRDLLDRDWQLSPDAVVDLLEGTGQSAEQRVLQCLLSGPLDIDKMDYLQRDSLHAGVPYGRNFDAQRLINSLCILNEGSPRLAITDKGRTAAEMMVFSRYIMFSEVYWHHAVRSATAMLQRAIWLLRPQIDLAAMCGLDESAWIRCLIQQAERTPAERLVTGLFGNHRRLYKRVAEFNVLDQPELHHRLARRPYAWHVQLSERLAESVTERLQEPVSLADVLVDAPPQKLEVDIAIDVVARNATVRSLGQVSPIVEVLAHQQFDNQVKRVRVFVRPDLRLKIFERMPPDWIAGALQELNNS